MFLCQRGLLGTPLLVRPFVPSFVHPRQKYKAPVKPYKNRTLPTIHLGPADLRPAWASILEKDTMSSFCDKNLIQETWRGGGIDDNPQGKSLQDESRHVHLVLTIN